MNGQRVPKSPRVAVHWPFPAGPPDPISVDSALAGTPLWPPLRAIFPGPSRRPAMVLAGNLLAAAVMAAVAVVVLGLATFGVGALWTAVVQHYP